MQPSHGPRFRFVQLLCAIVILALTGCGGRVASPDGGSAAPKADSAEFKVDLDKAKQEGKITFYTSLEQGTVDKITKAFREKYGIDIEVFRAPPAQVSSKVFAEAETGKIRADVIDSSDWAAFIAMKDKGFLQPYKSGELDKLKKEVWGSDYYWVGNRITLVLIGYNSKLVTGADVPKSWKDLTDPKYAGKLVFYNTSGSIGHRFYALAQYFGWDYLEQLAKQKPMMVGTAQLAAQANESGERPVSFAQSDSLLFQSHAGGKPVEIAYPSDGVLMDVGAVGLSKDTSKPNASRLFFDFWIGQQAQQIMVADGKWSPRSDVGPPAGAPALSSLKLLTIDYAGYEKQRGEILKRMGQMFGGQW